MTTSASDSRWTTWSRRSAFWSMCASRAGTISIVVVLVLFGLFYVAPMFRLLLLSVFGDSRGDMTLVPSIQSYVEVFSSPLFVPVILDTLRLSFIVTVVVLFLGYPVAYMLATARPGVSTIILLMVLVPLWTSILVRTYAWIVILQRQGLINRMLEVLGITHAPLDLIFNEFAVIVGSAHIMLPFMVLPIFGALHRMDPSLIRAAYGLGAGRRRTFWEIIVPLSMPGIAAGVLIVFIMTLGFFVTPTVLGGGKVIMLAMAIELEIDQFLNWSVAGALSAILLVITLVFVLIYQRIFGFERLVRS